MKKKLLMTLAILACAALLVVGSVAGTLAYLRSMATVTNTFNYGKVSITMDETKISGNTVQWGTRETSNTYVLKADTTYVKDPVIHIAAGSENMYLFVKIDNGIAGLAVTDDTAGTITIHNQMLANGWKIYETAETTYDKTTTKESNSGLPLVSRSTVYYLAVPNGTAPQVLNSTFSYTNVYNKNQITGANGQNAPYVAGDIPTFQTFTTTGKNVTEASLTAYYNNGAAVTITAFAVQAEANEFMVGGQLNFDKVGAIFASEWTSAATAKAASGS